MKPKGRIRAYRAVACRVSDLCQREEAVLQDLSKTLVALDVGVAQIERPDEIILCHAVDHGRIQICKFEAEWAGGYPGNC